MIKTMYILLISFTISFASTKELSAEIVANWHLYEGDVALIASTSPQDPKLGKTTGIFIAFEKSMFKCRPTVSLMSYDGLVLGQVTTARKFASKSAKNRMSVEVNGEKFSTSGETVINDYTNGTEIVAMFDGELLRALQRPATVSIFIGGGPPVFMARSLNSVTPHVDAIYKFCTG
jgi:hypothetical protein